MEQPSFYTLYRQTSVGLSLSDAIDKLIQDGKITQRLANAIMVHFDRIMTQCLQEKVKTTLVMKGRVDTYRFCDDVWTFVVENVNLKFTDSQGYTEEMNVLGKVRLVACNSLSPPSES